MDKPRLFLGSSGQQEKLLQALTRGLSDIVRVEPWMTSFNPGTSLANPVQRCSGLLDHHTSVVAQKFPHTLVSVLDQNSSPVAILR
jgi:hypothetical protein